jgi:hypothetical protein
MKNKKKRLINRFRNKFIKEEGDGQSIDYRCCDAKEIAELE